MKINKMQAEYEKHKSKKYNFRALVMDTIQTESKDNFGRMLNSFRYGYLQGRKAALAELKGGKPE